MFMGEIVFKPIRDEKSSHLIDVKPVMVSYVSGIEVTVIDKEGNKETGLNIQYWNKDTALSYVEKESDTMAMWQKEAIIKKLNTTSIR